MASFFIVAIVVTLLNDSCHPLPLLASSKDNYNLNVTLAT